MAEPGRKAGGGTPRGGKYQAFAKLGEGGMAQVFLALARGPVGFNKLCVIKRMRSQYAKDDALVTMFIDEARLAARLSHPNVIHTYEVGENAGLYLIAMEYLEGQPLNRIVQEARKEGRHVPQGVWIRIVRDALVGLQYAHDLKDYDGKPLHIVHRDVSPHNVFVTYDGQVKVVDFGIAKAAVSQTRTESGVLKGKVAYMSPEQARGEAIDGRSDLFAAGIVLWEALAGQNLFRHEYAATTLHKLLHEKPPLLSRFVPDIDRDLETLVAKSLAAKPEDRFQSAHEMRAALDAWLEAHDEVVPQEEVGELVSSLFHSVRQAVQRQVQAYMEGIGAATPGEGSGSGRRPSGSGMIRWSAGEGQLPSIEEPAKGRGRRLEGGPEEDDEAPPGHHEGDRRRGSIVWLLVATLVGSLVAAAVVVARMASHDPSVMAAPVDSSAAASSEPTLVPSSTPTAPVAPAPPPSDFVDELALPPVASAHPSTLPSHGAHAIPPGAPPAAATASAAAEAGFLSFDTYPWTRVSEAGRIIGDTPLVHVTLSAGPHVLTLDNPEHDIHQTYTVTINPGESVSRRLGLE